MKAFSSISKHKTTYLSALAIAVSGSMISLNTQAQENGFNVGLDLGQAEAAKVCDNITQCDSSDTSAKVHAGYQFNPNVGIEVGYVSFGTIFKSNESAVAAREKASAITASALGTINFTDVFAVYGRAGAARYNTHGSGTVSGVPVKDENGISPLLGAGLKLNLTDNLALRAEYQVYKDISKIDGKKDNVNAMYAGFVLGF